MPDQTRVERLRFRSWHRGTREMDLIMGSFADAHLREFSDKQLDQYEAILAQNDPDLYGWITTASNLPHEQSSDVMRMLCAHQFVKNSD